MIYVPILTNLFRLPINVGGNGMFFNTIRINHFAAFNPIWYKIFKILI